MMRLGKKTSKKLAYTMQNSFKRSKKLRYLPAFQVERVTKYKGSLGKAQES